MVSFDSDGDLDVTDLARLDERLALLLGSEKTGSSDDLLRFACDTAAIGMDARAESLNVSVAAGIALHARAARNLAR